MKLALGTLQSGGPFSFYPDADKTAFKSVIREALKNGITTFDSAYSYSDAETILSSVLKEQHVDREDVEIIDKVLPLPSLERKVETSLRRLNSSYIDDLLIHWPPEEDKELYIALKTLEKLKEEEKILHIGVSNFSLSLIKKISLDFEIELIERPYSLLWTRDAEETLLVAKGRMRCAFYAPLCFGLLSGRYRKREDLKDKRSSLPFFSAPSYLPLLDTLNSLSTKYSVPPVVLSLAFALNSKADIVIVGARD